jgi:hypothetical protein
MLSRYSVGKDPNEPELDMAYLERDFFDFLDFSLDLERDRFFFDLSLDLDRDLERLCLSLFLDLDLDLDFTAVLELDLKRKDTSTFRGISGETLSSVAKMIESERIWTFFLNPNPYKNTI